jgi:PKD repeat protein
MPNIGRRLRMFVRDRTGRSRGQSLVELALVAPVLLLILLVAVDFGRIYLGYVNLQQMARVAGGFASEHASAWDTPNDADVLADYQDLVANDAAAINCELPKDGTGNVQVPDPAFPAGFDIGDPIQISIPCNFQVLTPIISWVLGDTVPVSASTTYPVKEGAVAEVPGGGGPIIVSPVADFVGIPTSGFGQTDASGYGELEVVFTDLSQNGPTSWQWSFGDGSGTAFSQGPHTVSYECDRLPGETCTFTVRLTVGGAGGFVTETKTDYITVTVPPATGPVAEFTANRTSGVAPLSVTFTFDDRRNGTVTYASYEWDFDADGTYDDTGISATHNYATPGTYSVSLRVTETGTGATNVQTKTGYIVVSPRVCRVPDFANRRKNDAQGVWAGADFTTNVQFAPGNGNYVIHTQTILGGTIDPQPDGCDSTITVGP